jgi:uncharacterized membrane protein
MTKSRLEAFSDGVLAIIITIMVLELKVPHEASLAALVKLWPVLLSYIMSFVFIAIYWNNHHHMFQMVHRLSGGVLWANMHLLFWLSLVPFVTGWMGENHFARLPVAVYGIVLLCAGIAYFVLARVLVNVQGKDSDLARALGSDKKGRVSLVLYAIGIALAFPLPAGAAVLYGIVELIWLVPDRRIEKHMVSQGTSARQ